MLLFVRFDFKTLIKDLSAHFRGLSMDGILDFESWGHATRIMGVRVGGAAAGVDITEVVGVARVRGTLPPKGSRSGGIMFVLYLTVACSVVCVLL